MALLKVLIFIEAEFGFWMPDEDLVAREHRVGQRPRAATSVDSARASTLGVSTRRLPLRGADLVLMAMQALWRHGEVSNNALLVVECDGPLPVARVARLSTGSWTTARGRRRA